MELTKLNSLHIVLRNSHDIVLWSLGDFSGSGDISKARIHNRRKNLEQEHDEHSCFNRIPILKTLVMGFFDNLWILTMRK